MNSGVMILAVGGVIGVLLALFGATMLVTGHGPESTVRRFPEVRDAALYHLLFGAALILIVVAQTLLGGLIAAAANGVGVLLVVVAVFRYRPRRGRTSEDR